MRDSRLKIQETREEEESSGNGLEAREEDSSGIVGVDETTLL